MTPTKRRGFVALLFVFAGLAGCETHPEPATTPAPVTTREKIEEGGRETKEKAAEVANQAADATAGGLEKTGQAIENQALKLETSVEASAEKHLGQTVGKVVEATGKGLDKLGAVIEKEGDKLDNAVKNAESK